MIAEEAMTSFRNFSQDLCNAITMCKQISNRAIMNVPKPFF